MLGSNIEIPLFGSKVCGDILQWPQIEKPQCHCKGKSRYCKGYPTYCKVKYNSQERTTINLTATTKSARQSSLVDSKVQQFWE
jgi:hypothetical protein